MNELALQKLMVDAVKGVGGQATKMNNQFLVGISDLLLKLPDRDPGCVGPGERAAGFIEVKQRVKPVRDINFNLDITHAQAKFLDDWDAAGTPCGVASFLQEGSGSGLKLYLFVCPWKTMRYTDNQMNKFSVASSAHQLLDKKDRAGSILAHLYKWHDSWRAGK